MARAQAAEAAELAELQAEADLPIEALLARYGHLRSSEASYADTEAGSEAEGGVDNAVGASADAQAQPQEAHQQLAQLQSVAAGDAAVREAEAQPMEADVAGGKPGTFQEAGWAILTSLPSLSDQCLVD